MNILKEEREKILENVKKHELEKDERKIGEYPFKSFPLSWITLYLSYKCTRRCPSCYTLNQKDNDKLEMTDEMFEVLLNFLVKTYNDSDVYHFLITFLGGEPLLRTDRIKRIMDKVNSETPGMAGSIFTNGDLIDKINWDEVYDVNLWNLNVTDISVKEADRRLNVISRKLDEKDTLKFPMDISSTNKSCVQRHGIQLTVVATFDDYNIQGNRIEEMCRMALDNNHRLRLYRNLFKVNDEEYKKLLVKKYHSILDIIENHQAKGNKIFTTFLIDAMVPHDWGYVNEFFTPYTCGKRIISIRADGSVGPCLRNHNYSVGSIYSEKNVTEMVTCPEFRYTYKRDGIPEECQVCDVRDVCQSGCPNDKFINNGTFHMKSPWCKVHKEIIPRLMDLQRNNKKFKKYNVQN